MRHDKAFYNKLPLLQEHWLWFNLFRNAGRVLDNICPVLINAQRVLCFREEERRPLGHETVDFGLPEKQGMARTTKILVELSGDGLPATLLAADFAFDDKRADCLCSIGVT